MSQGCFSVVCRHTAVDEDQSPSASAKKLDTSGVTLLEVSTRQGDKRATSPSWDSEEEQEEKAWGSWTCDEDVPLAITEKRKDSALYLVEPESRRGSEVALGT